MTSASLFVIKVWSRLCNFYLGIITLHALDILQATINVSYCRVVRPEATIFSFLFVEGEKSLVQLC